MGSTGIAMVLVAIVVGDDGCSEPPSTARLQGPGDADKASGDGSGVISTSGPTPGDEIAEPADRELTLDRAADNVDFSLELRTGRPAF